MADPLIIIDPGHGGPDNPGTTAGGIVEKFVTLEIARMTVTALDDPGAGLDIRLLRADDSALTQRERGALSREMGAAFVLSLHVDERDVPILDAEGREIGRKPDPDGTGLVCYHYPGSTHARRVARAIVEHTPARLQSEHPIWTTARAPDWRKNAHAVVCAHDAPTVLVEMFFASSPLDVGAYRDPDVRAELVAALAFGVRQSSLRKSAHPR